MPRPGGASLFSLLRQRNDVQMTWLGHGKISDLGVMRRAMLMVLQGLYGGPGLGAEKLVSTRLTESDLDIPHRADIEKRGIGRSLSVRARQIAHLTAADAEP